MKKFILFLSVLLFVFYLPQASFSQIKPDPEKVKLAIKPGEPSTGSIEVSNISDKDIIINAYFSDFEFEPPFKGDMSILPLGASIHSFGQWISFFPSKFLVPASGKQEVRYTINPPKEAKGSYYGVLFFEREGQETVNGVAVLFRVGTTFYLDSQDKVKQAQIQEVTVDKEGIKGVITNIGNTLLFPQGTYFFMDEKGVAVKRGEFNKLFLPPGEKAAFVVPLPLDAAPGKYSLLLNVDLENGDVLVKEAEMTKEQDGSFKILSLKD